MALHVPAWKRLGLTLKHQLDHTSPNDNIPPPKNKDIKPNGTPSKKRKLADASDGSLDRERESNAHINTPSLPRGQTRENSTPNAQLHTRISPGSGHLRDVQPGTGDNAYSQQTKKSKKRNHEQTPRHGNDRTANLDSSVSASAEIKTPASASTPVSDTSKEHTNNALSGKKSGNKKGANRGEEEDQSEPAIAERRRLKRQKREQRRSNEGSTSAPQVSSNTSPYLLYLQQFHSDKENWKFNKNQQNYVLKYAFDPTRIPDDYQDALLDYLAGLQGLAARERIESTARDIVDAPEPELETSDMENSSAKKAKVNFDISESSGDSSKTQAKDEAAKDHEDKIDQDQSRLDTTRTSARKRDGRILKSALKKQAKKQVKTQQERSDEHQFKLWKRERARSILQMLAAKPLPLALSQPQKSHAQNGVSLATNGDEKVGEVQPSRRVRARKRRTGVPDDDSSSSSSSASSDSSSEVSSDSDSEDDDSDDSDD